MNVPKRIEPGLYTVTVDGEDFEIRQEKKRVETGKTHKGLQITVWRVIRDGQVQSEHDSYREAKEAVFGAPVKSSPKKDSDDQVSTAPEPVQQPTVTSLLFPGR